MRQDEFDFISNLLKTRSGLALTADKGYLLESRLLPIARSRGCEDLSGLINILKTRPDNALLVEVTEAMTTNESSFFRDTKPFEQLKQHILPRVREKAGSRRTLRIWSAAASTGQEAYTVAITLLEEASKSPGWKHEILATDLAQKVVDKAKGGIYTQFEVQRGMPIQLLLKYFKPNPDTTWQVGDMVRDMVNFRTQNLLEPFGSVGLFDIIFCRNVLIYFDEPTKAGVIDKLSQQLQPGGVLILGSTETILEKNKARLTELDSLRGIYVLK